MEARFGNCESGFFPYMDNIFYKPRVFLFASVSGNMRFVGLSEYNQPLAKKIEIIPAVP